MDITTEGGAKKMRACERTLKPLLKWASWPGIFMKILLEHAWIPNGSALVGQQRCWLHDFINGSIQHITFHNSY